MSTATVKASSAWVVRNGVYRRQDEGEWWASRLGVTRKPIAIYAKQNDGTHNRLVYLYDNTPPSAPASVSAYDSGTANKLVVTWSTTGIRDTWTGLIRIIELVPGPYPGDPDNMYFRETSTLTNGGVTAGQYTSTYTFSIGKKAYAEIRFENGTAYSNYTESNEVTF